MNHNLWHKRASVYDKLSWTKKQELLKTIKHSAWSNSSSDGFKNVCDIGTGTGTVAKFLAPFCKNIEAIDNSKDMLEIAKQENSFKNINYHLMNVEEMHFDDKIFDLIVARMTFHHVEQQNKAILECYRILKPGGAFVVCEAVPAMGVRSFFTDMFKLKEKRRVYSLDDLIHLLELGKFKDIDYCIYVMKDVSVRNWLENGKVTNENINSIFSMLKNAPPYVRKAFNVQEIANDVLLDWKFAIVSGRR